MLKRQDLKTEQDLRQFYKKLAAIQKPFLVLCQVHSAADNHSSLEKIGSDQSNELTTTCFDMVSKMSGIASMPTFNDSQLTMGIFVDENSRFPNL